MALNDAFEGGLSENSPPGVAGGRHELPVPPPHPDLGKSKRLEITGEYVEVKIVVSAAASFSRVEEESLLGMIGRKDDPPFRVMLGRWCDDTKPGKLPLSPGPRLEESSLSSPTHAFPLDRF